MSEIKSHVYNIEIKHISTNMMSNNNFFFFCIDFYRFLLTSTCQGNGDSLYKHRECKKLYGTDNGNKVE